MDYKDYFIILFKTILTIILSGLIGMERQTKNRPAGFRTHIMVCLGAMTIMILSEYIFEKYYTLYGINSDPTRMSAQVISGIGFLGAGTIIHYGTNVKGLTTAATLWVVATIGLTIGAGHYFLALVVTISLYFVLLMFTRFSKVMMGDMESIIEINLNIINRPKTIGAINMAIADFNGKILDMEFFNPQGQEFPHEEDNKVISLNIILKLQNLENQFELLNKIKEIKGVLDLTVV